MQSKDIRRIAVLAPGGATSNWRKLEGIMEFSRGCPDWEVQVVMSAHLSETRRALARIRPDGIIGARLDERTMAYVDSLAVPTVIAFHPDELPVRPAHARYVMSDSAQIGRKVARYAYSCGYRSFLCVGKRGSPWENERFDAFEDELAKFNCRAERLAMPFTSAGLLETLAALPQRTAVFAADDNVAVDVLNVARRHGLDVPRRFGVMGVSNLAIQCDNSHPPLTSLDQNFAQGGYLAAQRLKTLLRGGIVPKLSFYPPGEVHERSSLPPVQAQHSLAVDLATTFIERNVRKPIEVPDVVVAAGVSRRTLENLFRRELSASVAETIRNARLDHLAAQVAKSRAPLADICLACGWFHAAHAMRLFKRRFGMTMGEWREKRVPVPCRMPISARQN